MIEYEIKLTLKSEPMNEMLSHPPSWIIRSGNGLFLMILLLLIGLTWIINYSDEIIGEGIVSTKNAPIELSNQGTIQLKTLHAIDEQQIKQGDLIAEFDNQAKTADIEIVKPYLSQLDSFNFTENKPIPTLKTNHLQLGIFQESWINLNLKISEWNSLTKQNILENRIQSLQREINLRSQLESISKSKIKLSEKDYALLKIELESSNRLAEQNAISKQALNQEKRGETQSLQNVQSQKEQYIQNLISLNSLRKEIEQLKYDTKTQEEKLKSDIKLASLKLGDSFADWEKNAVWIAPCDGIVLFNQTLQLNQFYNTGKASIIIVPKGDKYIVKVNISATGAGKLKKNQQAFIELDDFPKNEYGVLEGKVDRVTKIEKEGNYEVLIRLPKQLLSSYKIKIPARAQLKGKVKIITKKKRLFERFFEKIIGLVQ